VLLHTFASQDFIEFCRTRGFVVLDEYKAEEKDLEARLTE
jgi:hypothetical protein